MYDEEYELSDEECPFYGKVIRKPYVEQRQKCDRCKYLKECIDSGDVLVVTMEMDVEEHYIPNIGVVCPL